MGKLIFITGGARSGKSKFAEDLLKNEDDVLYIATAIAFDDEMKQRIERHKKRRNQAWQTLEAYEELYTKLTELDKKPANIMLDCITVMVTNLMIMVRDINWDTVSDTMLEKIEHRIRDEVSALLEIRHEIDGRLVIVSNEVGMGLVPETPLGRHFRDIAGRINQLIAGTADEAYLLVSGLPVKLKG